ncbi:MAG: ComF family protein [Oscillospiraceae bacterium]
MPQNQLGKPLIFREWLLRLFFPEHCASCGEPLGEGEQFLCARCQKHLRLLPPDTCPKCARRLELCSCLTQSAVYRAAAAVEYDDVSAPVLWKLKFDSRRDLAPFLAQLMEQRRREFFAGQRFDGITYVPMSKAARRKRGYNQAQLLGRELQRLSGIPCGQTLLKVRSNRPQHELNAQERRLNVQGVYRLGPHISVRGLRILLVDDILTTGNTVEECSRVLLRAGAASVGVLCAASSLPREVKRYSNRREKTEFEK